MAVKEATMEQAKKAGGLVKEFKEFISRGNVVDMAVGMIIGSAFTAIVKSLVDDIFTPAIGAMMLGVNFDRLGVTIPIGGQPYINFGNFIQNIITFLITALCLFMVVKFMNAFRRKQAEAPPAPAAPTKDQELLTEIRDLLKAQQGAAPVDLKKTE